MNCFRTFPGALATPLGKFRFAAALILMAFTVVSARLCQAEDRPVIENSLGMKLVSIPAGEFLMGATEKEIAAEKANAERALNLPGRTAEEHEKVVKWHADQVAELDSEVPQHRVVITKPLLLGVYDVTQQEFRKIMGFNPSAFATDNKKRGKDLLILMAKVAGQDTSRYPVDSVTWDDAVEFCRQLSALPEELAAGRTYRLPTEAEWEYACRAGTTTPWYWSDKLSKQQASEYAWFKNKTSDDNNIPTHPVGQKKPNAWGLYDMVGNVNQWCADWFDPQTYSNSPLRDPTGPSSGSERVVRGEPMTFTVGYFRVARRQKAAARSPNGRVWRGFRVACELSTAAPQTGKTKPAGTGMQQAEARLKKKGLSRRMGYFLLPDEAQFIRYCSTIERLRVACFRAQKEYQEAARQVARAGAAQAGAVKARMQARGAVGYSDTWREHWAAVRATNQASDAALLAQLSQDDAEHWRKDTQDDLDNAVELFAQQIDKLQQMYQKLQTDYAKLREDESVKHALAAMNSQGKATYKIGPTPSAAAAVKKLEHEQGLLAQFKK